MSIKINLHVDYATVIIFDCVVLELVGIAIARSIQLVYRSVREKNFTNTQATRTSYNN